MTAPVKILSTMGVRGAMTEIAPALATRGIIFEAAYSSTNALMRRIADGEIADIALLFDSAIDDLIGQGKIIAGSRRDLARSGIGIAVRAGAAKPDISTVDAFKRTLLNARSVAYSKVGASGLYFASLIEHLGIGEEIKQKATVRDGVCGELAANGEVEIAVQQISELMLVAGIDIVGPLPAELQKVTVFSAGIFAGTPRIDDAKTLIAALTTADAAKVMRSKGLEPIAAIV